MTGHGSSSWATTLADLSIILFMITAADLANADIVDRAAAPVSADVAMSEPTALYRPGGSAPPLGTWLAQQAHDPRQQLTVVIRYRPGDPEGAMASGLRMVSQAEAAGREARMIAEPSDSSEAAAVLAYDASPKAVARKLQD